MRPPLSRFRPRTTDPRRGYGALAASAVAHGMVAMLIVVAAGDGERAAGPADARPEHVDYVDIGGWPGAEAATARTGAAPGQAISADAGGSGAPRVSASPAADANRPAIPVDSGAAASASSTGPSAAQVAGAAAGGAPGQTARTPLGPEYGDPRLVATPPVSSRAWADAARYEADFRTAWRVFRDSIQHQMDRERLAASWTWKDPNGRAWGVRNGELFLNGQRIMAMEMYGDRDQDREARMESKSRREIARQAEDIERDRYLRERGRASRARRDEERQGSRL